MWRSVLIVSVALVASACSGPDGETALDESGPSAPLASVEAEPTPPDRTPEAEPVYEDCAALAAYFARGGSSHDSLYDVQIDTLIVYSATESRQFRIGPQDADCISNSAAISIQVRDAVHTHQQNVGEATPSKLLDAAS
jgi:hypothetical protein